MGGAAIGAGGRVCKTHAHILGLLGLALRHSGWGKRSDMAEKIEAIDGMRGLSMVFIVGFWHLGEYHPAMAWMLNEVTLRVTVVLLALFVMISGYLAGRPLRGFSAQDLWTYYWGKFRKIGVPFYLVLPLYWVGHLLGGWGVIKAASLVSMFSPPAPPTLWFVLMIIVFFLLVPLVHFLISKMSFSIFWGLLLTLCVLFAKFMPFCDERLLLYLPIFVFGMLLNQLGAKKAGGAFSVVIVGIFFMASGWASWNFGLRPERDVESIPMALSGAWLVWRFAFRYWSMAPRFLKAVVTRVAACSYFLYLIHRPVYEWASQQFHVAQRPLSIMVLLPMLAFLAALIFQRVFEKWIDPALGTRLSK